jgi:hypothetical protein
MSQILDATLVIAALRMALGHRRLAKTLILPFRSRCSIRQRRLPTSPSPTRPSPFHESQSQLLR